jgi:signal transduction histidine kinase
MFEFEIEDNGSGIKKEHLDEGEGVNVMYFTTKGATKGTGMGISVMRQFAKYNGGSMRVESEYGQWTKIIMSLPLATQEQIEGVKNG